MLVKKSCYCDDTKSKTPRHGAVRDILDGFADAKKLSDGSCDFLLTDPEKEAFVLRYLLPKLGPVPEGPEDPPELDRDHSLSSLQRLLEVAGVGGSEWFRATGMRSDDLEKLLATREFNSGQGVREFPLVKTV